MLGDNEESISHLLWSDTITAGYFLLTSTIVFLKRENPEPILTVKIIEWRKFIDYFGLSIEADQSRVGKKNIYFVSVGSTPIPSYGQIYISRHRLDKEFNLELPKLRLYQLTKSLATDVAPHISSALRYLGVIFENIFYLVVPNWWMQILRVL